MHKLLLMSATYRQTSKINADQLEKDPENRLHGRASRFRMPAMVLRDWALACSGLLSEEIGGPPVYPYQPDQIWESLAITKERDFTYPQSTGNRPLIAEASIPSGDELLHQANMFDSANRRTCTVRLNQTCTPLHALTTLNDPTWVEAARSLCRAVHCKPEYALMSRLLLHFVPFYAGSQHYRNMPFLQICSQINTLR